MPYKVIKKKGARPWKIMKGNKIIATSTTKAKALRSIGYRENAEMIKKEQKWRSKRKIASK